MSADSTPAARPRSEPGRHKSAIGTDHTSGGVRDRFQAESPIRLYQDLVVGRRSWGSTFRHELLAELLARVPGAVGLVARKVLWPTLFKEVGRSVVWGYGISLQHPGKMRIGEGVRIDDDCYLSARGAETGEFVMGAETIVSRGSIIASKRGELSLGRRANVGAGCALYSCGGLRIGRDCLLAANCYVGGGSYNPDGRADIPMSEQSVPAEGVEIGDDCWLGVGVTVLDGVRIGRGSVIAAGAVVTEDIPPMTIAGGLPARVIRRRDVDAEMETGGEGGMG